MYVLPNEWNVTRRDLGQLSNFQRAHITFTTQCCYEVTMASPFPPTKRLKMDEQDRTFIPAQLDGTILDIPDAALRQMASYLPRVTRAVFATVMTVRSAEPSVFCHELRSRGSW